MATNFKVKMGEIGRLTFSRRLGIRKWYRNSDFKMFICDYIWLHYVKIWRTSVQYFGLLDWLRNAILLDLAGISTEFCAAITTQFCFSYSLRG